MITFIIWWLNVVFDYQEGTIIVRSLFLLFLASIVAWFYLTGRARVTISKSGLVSQAIENDFMYVSSKHEANTQKHQNNQTPDRITPSKKHVKKDM